MDGALTAQTPGLLAEVWKPLCLAVPSNVRSAVHFSLTSQLEASLGIILDMVNVAQIRKGHDLYKGLSPRCRKQSMAGSGLVGPKCRFGKLPHTLMISHKKESGAHVDFLMPKDVVWFAIRIEENGESITRTPSTRNRRDPEAAFAALGVRRIRTQGVLSETIAADDFSLGHR